MDITQWTNNFARIANSWQTLTGGGATQTGGGATQPAANTPVYATGSTAVGPSLTSGEKFAIMAGLVSAVVIGLIFWGRKK